MKHTRRCTSMHFGENQLSLRSIGISPDLPQLIPRFFNINEFGPPWCVTTTSTWPWQDHAVSGLIMMTRRPIRTRFPFASVSETLRLANTINSQTHSAKGTPSHLNGLLHTLCFDCLWTRRFQVLFHSPTRGSFHLSLTVLDALSVTNCI